MGKMLKCGNSAEFRKHKIWRCTTVLGNCSLSKQKLSGKPMTRLLENYATTGKIWLWIYSLWKKRISTGHILNDKKTKLESYKQ